MLAGALSDLKSAGSQGPLFENVQMRTINPKAVTMGQLYGETDRATQEWKDGVLGLTFRQLASDPSPDRKWCALLSITAMGSCLRACTRSTNASRSLAVPALDKPALRTLRRAVGVSLLGSCSVHEHWHQLHRVCCMPACFSENGFVRTMLSYIRSVSSAAQCDGMLHRNFHISLTSTK